MEQWWIPCWYNPIILFVEKIEISLNDYKACTLQWLRQRWTTIATRRGSRLLTGIEGGAFSCAMPMKHSLEVRNTSEEDVQSLHCRVTCSSLAVSLVPQHHPSSFPLDLFWGMSLEHPYGPKNSRCWSQISSDLIISPEFPTLPLPASSIPRRTTWWPSTVELAETGVTKTTTLESQRPGHSPNKDHSWVSQEFQICKCWLWDNSFCKCDPQLHKWHHWTSTIWLGPSMDTKALEHSQLLEVINLPRPIHCRGLQRKASWGSSEQTLWPKKPEEMRKMKKLMKNKCGMHNECTMNI